MQERNNKQRLMVLVALVTATVLAAWWGQRSGDTTPDPDLFAVPGLERVSEIELRSPGAEPVKLAYNGTRWRVNDRFDADREAIRGLFATLAQVRAKRPVPARLRDSTRAALEAAGVRVVLRSGGSPVGEFVAGGNAEKTQALLMRAGDNTPYIVGIPGFRLYVSGAFEQPEKEWRNKFVFAFNWRNFQRLESRIPKNSAADFTAALGPEGVSIGGLAAPDTARLNSYLDAVSLLQVDSFLDPADNPGRAYLDSLAASAPLLTLTVYDVGKNVYTLKAFHVPAQKRVYGLIGENQWAVFSENKIRPIFRSRQFFEKPKD